MAIHATSAVLAIAAVIAIALCFVFIVTLAIRKSNKKGMRSYKIIHVKPGNKNQMLGTHIGFEIDKVKFS